MDRYVRKSVATAPEGRRVLVSTVRHVVAVESAIFPVDEQGTVTSAMHLYKAKHPPEDDLDRAHEQLVAAVEAGTIPLEDREATQEEAEEALGDLILLAKMTDNRGLDGEDTTGVSKEGYDA